MIYSIALYLYALAVVLVSPFRKKAWLMVKGQWNTFRILRKNIRREEMYVWFHAASLGEFERGASADGAVAAGASGVQDIADLFLSFGL